MAFLRLIRYKNLIMIIVMMLLIKLCSVDPILALYGLEPTFSWLDFAFLSLALASVAAGGYVINDYFDTKADRINRPQSIIIGNEIPSSTAATWHIALSIAGCILGLLVSLRVQFWPLGLLFPLLAGLLWFYSTAYKGMFLVGNLVVAGMIGIVPLLPAIYELRGLIISSPAPVASQELDPWVILNISAGYAAFAFVVTLIREIIKDMEDIDGDYMQGCSTMPIALGYGPCKAIAGALALATIAGLAYAYTCHLNEPCTGIYFALALALPLILLFCKILTIKDKQDCSRCSAIAKIIMLLGMAYLFVAWHAIAELGSNI